MRFDQYSNVLQLAAALSMAGWVARTPGTSQDNVIDFNNQYSANQGARFHPYSQPNINEWRQEPQQQHGPLVGEAVAPQNNFLLDGRNSLYQSKDAEETFRAYMELQELISWQESYRRGDFPMGQSSNQHVMPVVNSDNNDQKFNDGTVSDDGYGSIGSPASSTISSVASEVDNLGSSGLPSPGSIYEGHSPNSQFSQLDDHIEGTFDIDEILNDHDNAMSPEMPYDDNQKVPFASLLSSLDDDLEYVNSPSALKNPGADSFLAKLSPEYNPPHTMTSRNDDPFNMQFTNSSLPDKFSSGTLIDIGDFNPSFFDNSRPTEEEILDKALVQSLSQKEDPATLAIKKEEDNDYWFKAGSPMVEHDYFNREDFKTAINNPTTPTTTSIINKHQPQRFNEVVRPASLMRRRPSSTNTNLDGRLNGGRTFAPSHTSAANNPKPRGVKSKVKQQKQKKSSLWNDFPYNSSELVEMSVEKFNEIIKQLDEVRQHIAKDERRKGKNKLAARNCRKRKMDIIDCLDTGIGTLEEQREALVNERQKIVEETRQIQRKTEWLNNYIFEHMRDSNGAPYSESDFSLQYTSDGNVYLVPSVGGGNQGN